MDVLRNKDELELLVNVLLKREQNLINDESVRKYNRNFDNMRKYARELINKNRQEELLPYLESDSVSIRRDVAGLLFHCYPEKCRTVLKEIGEMTVENGLPKCFINVSISAKMALENGVPKDFP